MTVPSSRHSSGSTNRCLSKFGHKPVLCYAYVVNTMLLRGVEHNMSRSFRLCLSVSLSLCLSVSVSTPKKETTGEPYFFLFRYELNPPWLHVNRSEKTRASYVAIASIGENPDLNLMPRVHKMSVRVMQGRPQSERAVNAVGFQRPSKLQQDLTCLMRL